MTRQRLASAQATITGDLILFAAALFRLVLAMERSARQRRSYASDHRCRPKERCRKMHISVGVMQIFFNRAARNMVRRIMNFRRTGRAYVRLLSRINGLGGGPPGTPLPDFFGV